MHLPGVSQCWGRQSSQVALVSPVDTRRAIRKSNVTFKMHCITLALKNQLALIALDAPDCVHLSPSREMR